MWGWGGGAPGWKLRWDKIGGIYPIWRAGTGNGVPAIRHETGEVKGYKLLKLRY